MARRRVKRKPATSKPALEQFVLDCSVALAWHFADEADDYADAVATSLVRTQAIVPAHWPLEVVNTLVVGERRGRSTQAQSSAFIGFLRSLRIVVDDTTAAQAWGETCNIARSQSLASYDAAYLELAQRRAIPIATLDQQLKSAAMRLGIVAYAPRAEPKALSDE